MIRSLECAVYYLVGERPLSGEVQPLAYLCSAEALAASPGSATDSGGFMMFATWHCVSPAHAFLNSLPDDR
jgi:hypothetical protein